MKETHSKKLRSLLRVEFFVILIALAIAIYSNFPALTNRYVFCDDVRQQIYWMQQFRDPDLFKGDLLTDYAKYIVPWGVTFLYYALSFIIDPIITSKLLPVILFSISALYVFKLVRHFTDNYTAFLTASIPL